MAQYQTLTDRKRTDDLVKWVVEERFCVVTGTIKNVHANTVAAGAAEVGHPLNLNGTQWELAVGAADATIDGLLIDERPLPELLQNGITALEYRILRRGPALVNVDAVPDEDLATVAAAFDEADIITALDALNIQVLKEPSVTETQET